MSEPNPHPPVALRANVMLRDQASQFSSRPIVPSLTIATPLSTMRIVGYRPKCAVLAKGKIYRDEEFLSAHPHLLDSPYQWGFPSIKDVTKSMLRFDPPRSAKLLKKPFKHAIRLVFEMFEPMRNTVSILPGEEVLLRSNSAPGPNYEHECDFYSDTVLNHSDEFHYLWREGYKSHRTYWKAAGKVDVLKKKKVEEGDFRTFIFSDAPFRWFSARLYQDFNNKSHGKIPWIYIGFDRTHGGFAKLGAEFSLMYRKLTCDAIKWDSGLLRFFFWLETLLVWGSYKAIYRTRENWERLMFALEERMDSLIILPTGEVVYKEHGNNSGDVRTSDLNSLAHLVIVVYGAVLFLLDSQLELSLDSLYRHFKYALYGDDNLGGNSKKVHKWLEACGGPVQFFTNLYAAFGMNTHPDKMVYTSNLEGLVFLGGVFKLTPHGWGHGFDAPKLMYAMSCSEKRLDRVELWEKWRSLLSLLCFEEERHIVRHHMLKMKQVWLQDLTEANPDLFIPTDYDLLAFWFGWESIHCHCLTEGGNKNSSAGNHDSQKECSKTKRCSPPPWSGSIQKCA